MKKRAFTALRIAAMTFAMSVAAFVAVPFAVAHTGQQQEGLGANALISTEEHAFGKQGNPESTSRTITVDMTDMMRFHPADITVRQGETIRFMVTNKGQMLHEMVIGTMEGLRFHAEMMRKHPGMEHDEPYMSHVGAGQKNEMVWQFTKAGEFYYACLIPGHLEAGMLGKITVTKG